MSENKSMSHRHSAERTGPARDSVRKPAAEKPEKAERNRKGLPVHTPNDSVLSPILTGRVILSIGYLVLFLLLFMNTLGQEGLLPKLLQNVICGLFGQATYYMAIPATLYLGVLHAVNSRKSVKLRAGCVLLSMLLVGSFAHILTNPTLGTGLQRIADLYTTGTTAQSGGVICGMVGGFLKTMLSKPLALLALALGVAACAVSFVGMTPVKLVRAFRNRPRFEEDEKVPEEEPDRAVQLVNTLTVRHHEIRQKLQQHHSPRLEEPETGYDSPWDQEEPSMAERTVRSARAFSGLSALFHRKKDRDLVYESYDDDEEPDESVYVQPEPVWEPEEDDEGFGGELPEETGEPEEPVHADLSKQKVTAQDAADSALEVTREIEENQKKPAEKPVYEFPSVDLLNQVDEENNDGTEEMRENTRRLNETLASFKIDARVTNVTRGPSVTRYEVELQQGVRLNKLTSVAEDIALNLGLGELGVRIAPVPNKISVVGIEVPNQSISMVTLRDVVTSDAFRNARNTATFAVGKDIGGRCIIGCIPKLPHMLIAGTTGSGKSVCMNTIILSILFKASPDDVRLIMIDPKMVELGIYNDIPHLLIPVVTDPKKAAGSLQWAVTEMMRRYKLMSEASVRDISSYNEVVDNGSCEGEHMAQIVVIIDELADLMLVAAKEVEESICRIAQMGRAAGVHLIIATQRPSADVITGLMKANIPSRIAFQVSSGMESRIILDTTGAEKLLGKGDMLYAPIGCGKPVRVQGCFVSDAEVEAVTTYIKDRYSDTYDKNIQQEIDRNAAHTGTSRSASMEVDPSADETAFDEMLIPAVDAVFAAQQASVSMLQRKLKLGFSRAARIVDTMEELGIVGEHAGSKPRQILITPDQWAQMKISLSGGEIPEVPESDQMTMDDAMEELDDEPVPDELD